MAGANNFPKLHNAMWPGLVGKGSDSEPPIDLDTMLDLTAKAEVNGVKFDGIDIFHAESDTIELRLLTLPKNLRKFAEELYDFCPDIVTQGTRSVRNLEIELRESQYLYCWWD